MPLGHTYVGFHALVVCQPRRNNSIQVSTFSKRPIGRFTIPPRLVPGALYLLPRAIKQGRC
jgi:hypothetical protein